MAIAAMLVAFAVATPFAVASPAAACNLVTDPSGDVEPDITGQVRPAPPSKALDLMGGDIAADEQSLTTIIKVLGQIGGDAYSPTGYRYSFQFTVDTGDSPQSFEMSADIGPAAQNYAVFRNDQYTGTTGLGLYIRGSFDNTRHEIRMTVDMSQLRALAPGTLLHPDGHRLRDFEIASGTSNGDQRVAYVSSEGEDLAHGDRPIKIGAPSCVRPG
jgi:hypothetical protein